MVPDVQEAGRESERAREEMTTDVGTETEEEGDGQRGKKEKKLHVTTCLILVANYGLRSLGLALTFLVYPCRASSLIPC